MGLARFNAREGEELLILPNEMMVFKTKVAVWIITHKFGLKKKVGLIMLITI